MSSFFSRSFLLAGLVAAPSLFAITPAELAGRLARNETVLLVDVRPAHAYNEAHIPGAINIPLSLLKHKKLPTSQPVVVYGDGLGVVNDAQALELSNAKSGVNADVLEGGYAAWLAETRLSTALPGVGTEKLPAISYDQLVAANKSDMVLLDLRMPAPAAGARSARSTDSAAIAGESDLVDAFAARLGVPVVATNGGSAVAALAREGGVSAMSTRTAGTKVKKPDGIDRTKLLVLVADDEASAMEMARQLRATGHYRFTVLVGGTEVIRHQGRQGLGRMDGRPTPIQQ